MNGVAWPVLTRTASFHVAERDATVDLQLVAQHSIGHDQGVDCPPGISIDHLHRRLWLIKSSERPRPLNDRKTAKPGFYLMIAEKEAIVDIGAGRGQLDARPLKVVVAIGMKVFWRKLFVGGVEDPDPGTQTVQSRVVIGTGRLVYGDWRRVTVAGAVEVRIQGGLQEETKHIRW